MPRLPRIIIEGAVYFITCRGANDERLFKDERDYAMFVELLKKYREQYDIKIFAYVLMPDHLHLLIELKGAAQRGAPANPTGPGAAQRGAPANPIGPGGEAEPAKTQELSEFMHGLNNAYTKYFNGRYERKGHLFRERFKAAIVERDNYLLKMTVYLHLNPQKLNLVSNASAYPYSSYAAYTGTDQAHAPGQQAGQGADTASFGGLDLRNEVAEILTLLGTKSYVQYVNEMNAEDAAFLQKRLSRGGIIGSDDFVRRVREQASVYQSQPQAAEQEISTQRHWRVFVTTGGLVLIAALTVGGGLFI